MSDWQDKSDFEINKAVAETDKKFNSCIDVEFFISDSNEKAVDVVSQGLLICTVDYCNDWAYGGPIIQSVGISLVFMGDYWEDHALINEDEAHNTQDENPIRAAMIVYLEMNGAKPNE